MASSTTASEALLEQLRGRVVADYVIGEKLGQGGFGVVYRAHQRHLEREVVLKVLRPRAGGAEARQRFLREARLASRFDHPFAAHVYDCGAEDDGLLWIAMELVRGTPLDEYVREHGPFTPAQFAPLCERICQVVQSAHEQGIVHRDLKPANVMVVERAGQLLPKLLDFGIAKAQDVAVSGPEPDIIEAVAVLDGPVPGKAPLDSGTSSYWSETQGRVVLGSPLYMAPEQWLDAGATDARTDLYALGILCYEALTGRHPFAATTVDEAQAAHARQPVPPLGPGFGADLDGFFQRAMAKKPADRFAGSLELAASFKASAGLGPRRGWPVRLLAAAAAATVLILGGAGWWLRQGSLPSGERRVAVAALVRGAPAETWLTPAVQRLATRKLRAADRRFVVDDDPGSANVLVTIGHAREGDDIVLTADLGRTGGRARRLPPVRARSLAEALDALVPEIVERVDDGLPERGPDPEEASAMKRRGSSSRRAFELQRDSFDLYYSAYYTDGARAARLGAQAVDADPAWPHAYASLALVQSHFSDAAKATLARAGARMDRARDPAGAAIVDGLILLNEGKAAEAAALLAPVVRGDPDDWVARVGEAYAYAQITDLNAAIAAHARLHEARPDLQFGEDLSMYLRMGGRGEEVGPLFESWASAAPDSEQALLSLARQRVIQGRLAEARELIRRVLLVHGEQTYRLASAVDVLLLANEPVEAIRLAERMLAGSELDRALGLKRLAYAAVLQGRFGSAYENLQAGIALALKLGSDGESPDMLELLGDLAPLVASPAEESRAYELLAQGPSAMHDAVWRYEAALLHRQAGVCPSMDAELAGLPADTRIAARRQMLRAAEARGCATCAEVLGAGLLTEELHTRSLFRFAVCAEKEHALPLARATFERVADLQSSRSYYRSIMARFYLGRVLGEQGDKEASRAQYRELLAHWGTADYDLPEIEEARRALAAP